jgi:hypothetical protein
MSVSRRRFLTAGAIMSAALVLKPGTFVLGRNSLWSNSSPDPDHRYRREVFEPYVGDIFRVRVGKQMIDLKLVALDTISPASHGITTGKTSRTDCFSMQFHATRPLPATARIHNLNHGKLGSFDLFMTQSKKGSKFLQTAIINHVD